MKFSENALFGYANTPAGICCLGDDGGFSIELFEDGSLIHRTYIVDRADGREKAKKTYRLSVNGVNLIKELLAENQGDITGFDEYLDNGSCDGSFSYFSFNGKTVRALNIEYCDEEELKSDNPEYYKEYLNVIRQQNKLILLLEKIMEILEKDGAVQ